MSDSEVQPSGIELTANVDAFFRQLVTQASSGGDFAPSEASACYIASLLAESARPNPPAMEVMGDNSLTLMLAEALNCHGSERFRRLQVVGDGVLYVSGFFGQNLARRGVETDYVQHLGSTAYARAAAMLQCNSAQFTAPDVFRELSENFQMFVHLVHAVSDELMANSAQAPRDLVDVYERWLQAPSSTLTNLLVEHGLVPTRGASGAN